MDMKRFFLYAIVIAALVLAGCGGNGGGTTTMTGADDGVDMAALDAAKTAAKTAYDMAKDAVERVEANKSHDMDSYDKAVAEREKARVANNNAQDATTVAEAERYRDAAEEAHTNATRYAGMVTTAANNAAATAATKAAGTKQTAIEAEAAQTTDAGLGGSDALGTDTLTGTSDDPYSLTIERDASATTVKIADTGNAGDDDPKFMQAMDLGDGLTMHTRTMEADDDGNVVEEVVMVKTDIEAPKDTAFEKVPEQALNVSTNTDNDSPSETHEALNVSAIISALSDEAKTAALAKIMVSGFRSGGSLSGTFAFDDTNTATIDEAFESEGTYNGAAGTYRCNGTVNCSVTYSAKGEITDIGSDWIFTPDEGATSPVQDDDYLHYGFWLKKTTKDGVVTYDEVETFAGSSLSPTVVGDISLVVGDAKYEGSAVGVYVKNVYGSDGSVESATSGHFTADATLTAYFGGVDVAAAKQFTVEGNITDFALSGNDKNNNWSVSLKAADFSGGRDSDGSPGTDHANVFAGEAEGGGTNGDWSGTFYGETPETPATDDGTARVAPGSMAGEFDAAFSNGSVAGAFGARKKQ